MTNTNELPASISTGIAGLDAILRGGLTPRRTYLIEGEPGTGKTTTGLQFLTEDARNGESVAYITLAETAEELQAVAVSQGRGCRLRQSLRQAG